MLNVTKKYLLDDFSAAGTDAEEFMEWCKEIDDHTSHCKMNFEDLRILSVRPEAKELSEVTGTYPVWVMDTADPIPGGSLVEGEFDLSDYLNQGCKILTDEAYDIGCVLEKTDGEDFFVSINAFNTWAQRIDCDAKTLSHKNVGRDVLLAERMGQKEKRKGGTFVFKEAEGVKKLFAVMSERYAHVPLSTISDIVNTLTQPNWLGKAVCRSWSVEHKRVSIDFEFPEYAEEVAKQHGLEPKLIPCVTLMTSDIGECSFTAKGYWKYGNTLLPDLEFSKEHKGGLDHDQLYHLIENNIFYKYTVLPEKLANLMKIDVTGNTPLGEDNRVLILAMYEEILHRLGFKDILGQKRFDELLECIDYAYIDDALRYTGYDLCMDVFGIPAMLTSFLTATLSTTVLSKIEKAVPRAALLDYEILRAKADKNKEKLYLRESA